MRESGPKSGQKFERSEALMTPDGISGVQWTSENARYIGDGVYAAPSPVLNHTLILRTDRGFTPHVIALEPEVLRDMATSLRAFYPDLRIEGFAYTANDGYCDHDWREIRNVLSETYALHCELCDAVGDLDRNVVIPPPEQERAGYTVCVGCAEEREDGLFSRLFEVCPVVMCADCIGASRREVWATLLVDEVEGFKNKVAEVHGRFCGETHEEARAGYAMCVGCLTEREDGDFDRLFNNCPVVLCLSCRTSLKAEAGAAVTTNDVAGSFLGRAFEIHDRFCSETHEEALAYCTDATAQTECST